MAAKKIIIYSKGSDSLMTWCHGWIPIDKYFVVKRDINKIKKFDEKWKDSVNK